MPTPYNDLYVRDNFSDAGVIPSSGSAYYSPDIIPYQSGALAFSLAQSAYAGPDLGKNIVLHGVNNIYVRAKNLNSAAGSGSVQLYWALFSLILTPNRWTPVTTPGGAASTPLADGSGNPLIGAGAIALSSPAFLLTNLPPASSYAYCLVAVVQTAAHPVTIPASFPSNAAYVQWVQNNPAVGHRNVYTVANAQTQIVQVVQFGSDNTTGDNFHFRILGRGYAVGTGVNVQCTDAACPIQWSGTLPAADPDGNQIIGFDNWIPATYTGNLTVTLTSPSGPFPPAAPLSITVYQYPQADDALHQEVGRFAMIARDGPSGREQVSAFLITIGECTLITSTN